MATVTGYTAARMKQIEDSAIIDGDIVGDNLILKRFDTVEINAGNIRGPQGIQGPPGQTPASFTTAQRDALTGGELWAGRFIYNSTTLRLEWYTGTTWQEVNKIETHGVSEILMTETTTSTTYANLATIGPSVTVLTGTKALLIITAFLNCVSANVSCNVSIAISGATTRPPIDEASLYLFSPIAGPAIVASHAYIVTGLTPGLNTFILKYKQVGGSATFAHRRISVVDMGS